MFIGCETSNGYPDYYWIDGVNTLEGLQEHIKNNIPVMGKSVEHRHNHSIVLKDDVRTTLIYLNNYMVVWEAFLYFMDRDEFKQVESSQCTSCKHQNQYWGCDKRFTLTKADDKTCKNYEKEIIHSFGDWIVKHFKPKSD